jgi:hypothetical protein
MLTSLCLFFISINFSFAQIERTLGKNLMKMRDTTADELYSQLSANKMLVRLISNKTSKKR